MQQPKKKEPKIQAVKVTEELLNEIVRKIVENFKVEKIILFGSYAWGKPREWSDIDLLIVMKTDMSPGERYIALARIAHPRVVPMDMIIKTPEEIKSRIEQGDIFYNKILKQGSILYAA